jgi:hypothetical protein
MKLVNFRRSRRTRLKQDEQIRLRGSSENERNRNIDSKGFGIEIVNYFVPIVLQSKVKAVTMTMISSLW